MKSAPTLVALLVFGHAIPLLAAPPMVSERREGSAWVRTVMHEDGSRTVSKKDDTVKEIEKWTLNASNVLVSRSIFQTDKEGRFQRGQVYDGAGNLRFVSEFIYDSLGRQIEERVSDARGAMVRRLIYSHDQFGRAKPFSIPYQNGAAGSPVAVRDAERYSSTSDRGFQVDPDSGERASAPARAEATFRSSRDEPSARAGIFKSSAKKSFRNPKRR